MLMIGQLSVELRSRLVLSDGLVACVRPILVEQYAFLDVTHVLRGRKSGSPLMETKGSTWGMLRCLALPLSRRSAASGSCAPLGNLERCVPVVPIISARYLRGPSSPFRRHRHSCVMNLHTHIPVRSMWLGEQRHFASENCQGAHNISFDRLFRL